MKVEKRFRDIHPLKKTACQHNVKCRKVYFWKVKNLLKNYEIRKNDRNYKAGDVLKMFETSYNKETGRFLVFEITHVLKSFEGLKKGYCILSLLRFNHCI